MLTARLPLPASCLMAAMALACQPTSDSSPLTPMPLAPEVEGDPGPWPGGSVDDWDDASDGLRRHIEGAPGEGDEETEGAADDLASADGAERDGDGLADAPGEPGGVDEANGLEGGEIDDNALFTEYLTYAAEALEQIGDDPAVHWLDVERRHFVTVLDAEARPVPDASVAVRTPDGQLVTWGRTRADGRFAFFPRAYGPDRGLYAVEATAGALVGGADLSDNEAVRITLDGVPDEAPLQVDVAFVIDATGSMSEEIARIKQTITDIATRVAETSFEPDLRFGLVAYRDRGDAFVTRTVDFTPDVEAFQQVIDALEANGGGDFPEALNEALFATMRRLDWRRGPTLRMAFVVADAPAHHYEQQSYVYRDAMLDAATMGVKIFPVASGGSDPVAELQLRQLAQFTLGHFIFITEGGGSPDGSGGSDYDVDPADFVVERLDDLIVRLIGDEMTTWRARGPQ